MKIGNRYLIEIEPQHNLKRKNPEEEFCHEQNRISCSHC